MNLTDFYRRYGRALHWQVFRLEQYLWRWVQTIENEGWME